MESILSKVVSLRSDGKINVPKHFKHIKLDIGLSYSAPMSQHWLSNEENLIVFGFEPNPMAVESILKGAIKKDASHGSPLEKKFIGTSFFLIPCALGLSKSNAINFFVTKEDCGCSSIYPPKSIEVERQIEVPIFSLSDFFDQFPFDSHPVIDYIKIDAQGSDLDIIKSAKQYLKERVIYITLEAEDDAYQNTQNSFDDIQNYMLSIGFIPYKTKFTSDPTYFNPNFSEYCKNNKVEISQF